jgi:hypothetical protein
MGEQDGRVTGSLRIEERTRTGRVHVAAWTSGDGRRHRKLLGPAWVKDSGKRTPRGNGKLRPFGTSTSIGRQRAGWRRPVPRTPADGVLKGQDIVLLVALLDVEEGWTLREVGEVVELAPGAVHRSLARSADAQLYDAKRRRVLRGAVEEFLLHGLRYVFPARPQGEVRGVPTAWAAPPLDRLLAMSDPLPPVWPDAEGSVRGLALEPLHAGAVGVARRRPATAELLALLDAMRAGDARVRGVAADELRARLAVAA